MNPEVKSCQNCKSEFPIEPEDFEFYAKVAVPPPTWCPTCRTMRRAMFGNYSLLFRKTEKRTGKVLFSTYPEASPYEIYEHDYWWSDAWDAMEYGRDYDFSRPFFSQFYDLLRSVPLPSKAVRGMINSDYSNAASYLKNCYLVFNGGECENCYYSNGILRAKECIDTYGLIDSELCYEVFQGTNNYQCFFSTNLIQCMNVWFSENCTGCQDCFGCVGLKQKQYCLFNEQLSKEEYGRRVAELNTGSYKALEAIRARVREVALIVPHKFYHGGRCVDVSGDYLFDSKNAHDAYEASGMENVRYSDNLAQNIKDCYDYTSWGENVELLYESIQCGDGCSKLKFCNNCWPAMRESEYAFHCQSSANLFACAGLRKKQYCILNKQYSKEEYEELRIKIIQHMDAMPYVDAHGRTYKYGEFCPPEFSPLAYNETLANNYFPKTQAEISAMGFLWREPDARQYEITIQATDLTDDIAEAGDNITAEQIACLGCKRAYRILPYELNFYRRFSAPLPRQCHLCRYRARVNQRNPRRLYQRSCQCAGDKSSNGIYTNTGAHDHGSSICPRNFKTTYSPERKEIVYCEPCYQREKM